MHTYFYTYIYLPYPSSTLRISIFNWCLPTTGLLWPIKSILNSPHWRFGLILLFHPRSLRPRSPLWIQMKTNWLFCSWSSLLAIVFPPWQCSVHATDTCRCHNELSFAQLVFPLVILPHHTYIHTFIDLYVYTCRAHLYSSRFSRKPKWTQWPW